MTTPTIADLLKYSDLQMAAEAFLRVNKTGAVIQSGDALVQALTKGNERASRFTEAQAKAFADPTNGWTVLDQRANTSTETLHKSAVCVLGVSPVGENWRHETSSAEPQSVSQENP